MQHKWATCGLLLISLACSKQEAGLDPTGANISLSTSLGSDLQADLSSSGVSSSQALSISNEAVSLSSSLAVNLQASIQAKTDRQQALRFSASGPSAQPLDPVSLAVVEQTYFDQITEAFTQGAMAGLGKVNNVVIGKATTAGIIAASPLKQIDARTDIGDDKKLAAIQKISAAAVGGLDEAGLDASQLSTAVGAISEKAVEKLATTKSVSNANKSLMVTRITQGAINGLKNISKTKITQNNTANSITASYGGANLGPLSAEITRKAVAKLDTAFADTTFTDTSFMQSVISEVTKVSVKEIETVSKEILADSDNDLMGDIDADVINSMVKSVTSGVSSGVAGIDSMGTSTEYEAMLKEITEEAGTMLSTFDTTFVTGFDMNAATTSLIEGITYGATEAGETITGIDDVDTIIYQGLESGDTTNLTYDLSSISTTYTAAAAATVAPFGTLTLSGSDWGELAGVYNAGPPRILDIQTGAKYLYHPNTPEFDMKAYGMRYASYSRDDGTYLYTIIAGAGSDGMTLRAVFKSNNSDSIIDQPHGVDIESKLLAYTVSDHPMLGPKSAFYSIADFHFDNMDESGRMHPAIFTESKRASSYSDPNNNMPPYKNEYATGKQDLNDYLASQQGPGSGDPGTISSAGYTQFELMGADWQLHAGMYQYYANGIIEVDHDSGQMYYHSNSSAFYTNIRDTQLGGNDVSIFVLYGNAEGQNSYLFPVIHTSGQHPMDPGVLFVVVNVDSAFSFGEGEALKPYVIPTTATVNQSFEPGIAFYFATTDPMTDLIPVGTTVYPPLSNTVGKSASYPEETAPLPTYDLPSLFSSMGGGDGGSSPVNLWLAYDSVSATLKGSLNVSFAFDVLDVQTHRQVYFAYQDCTDTSLKHSAAMTVPGHSGSPYYVNLDYQLPGGTDPGQYILCLDTNLYPLRSTDGVTPDYTNPSVESSSMQISMAALNTGITLNSPVTMTLWAPVALNTTTLTADNFYFADTDCNGTRLTSVALGNYNPSWNGTYTEVTLTFTPTDPAITSLAMCFQPSHAAPVRDVNNVDYTSTWATSHPVSNNIQITFDANGGVGLMNDINTTVGSNVTLESNKYTRTSHTYTGWNTAPDGSGTGYLDMANFTANNNLTLYAQWQPYWTHQAYLKAPNAEANDEFADSVSVSGDTIVVVARLEDSTQTMISTTAAADNGGSSIGAAYVFVRSGTTWSQQAYLKAPEQNNGDAFGSAIALSGDTIVVGARLEDSSQTYVTNGPTASNDNSASSAGAAYVFVRCNSANTWSQQAYLKAPNAEAGDYFGDSVSVSGDTIVVGAYQEDSNQTTVSNSGSLPTPAGDDNSASDAGAAYVFTRNGTTWSQQAYLKAPNPSMDDHFGWSVSVSGDTVVVGVDREDSSETNVINNTTFTEPGTASNSGAAYVFVRNGTTWLQQSYLKAPNAFGGDQFGYSVSASGDTIVVGATHEDSSQNTVTNGTISDDNGANGSGAAYVFTRSGTTWSYQAYLKAPNPGASDNFGSKVSASGDTIVVGTKLEDSNQTTITNCMSVTTDDSATDSGAAYVFARSGSTWSHQAYLKAPNAGAQDNFGSSVSVSGDTIVVGAHLEDSSETSIINNTSVGTDPGTATESGAAYVFVRNIPDVTQYIVTYNANGSNNGKALPAAYVPNSDNHYVVPSPSQLAKDGTVATHWNTAPDGTGTSYMPGQAVTLTGNLALYAYYPVWVQQAYLKAPNAEASDNFGRLVSISGDTVVVGADYESSSQTTISNDTTASNDNSAPGAGAAYVFARSGTTWTQQAYLKADNLDAGDLFGRYGAVDGDTIVVGAIGESSNRTGVHNGSPGYNNDSITSSGAAYVYVRSGTTWSQQAYLKAPNAEANDAFGSSISVSGDTIVVCAYKEDSNETTITNGLTASDDNSASASGAAYVFTRSGTTWSYQAYLKAPNAEAGDMFGIYASVFSDTIVVGAHGEDSNQTTITNGTSASSDNSAIEGGAAYVFIRSGASWSHQAYLKAPNANANDSFGLYVHISGDTIVSGAIKEASNQTTVTNGSSASGDDSAPEAGAAYVFVRNGTTWSQQAYLKAANAESYDWFSKGLSLSGDTIVVGAYNEDSNQTTITNGPTASSDNSAVEAGAAYVFERSGTMWSQQAYLKAANAEAGDEFGRSVSISGDTIVVGAHYEDSNQNTITNGATASSDNSATDSGAAYVFVRQ